MKKEPEIQKQHRLSQVYLKKFGFEENDNWKISVLKLGNESTGIHLISEFTTEINIFDYPFSDPEIKRHFENTSNKVENFYNRVLNNIQNQKRITPRDKDLLNNFVPNLLCRTSHFRNFIKLLLEDKKTKKKLLDEITLFQEDNRQTEFLLEIFEPNNHLNITIGTLMNHLVHVFRSFKKVVLKAPDSYSWLTTDNPVIIDKQDNYEWIIPIEAEIYFPLSKKYCLFLFNSNSDKKNNKLRNLKIDKVNLVDYGTFDSINKIIVHNIDQYLIFSEKMNPTKI